jgi:hypothetical protein
MKTTKLVRFVTPAIAAILGLILAVPIQAESKSHSGEVLVEQPADLPELAQVPGESLFLYHAGDGETYLYVEQKMGARLAVFNVTDPAKITTASSIALNAPGPFDFERQLNDQSELIRFRDNLQVAELDLHAPKSPTLKIVNALNDASHAQSLGKTAFLVTIDEPSEHASAVAHDYKVVDLSNPAGPTSLATIKQVKHMVVNDDSGTTFVLSGDGLTVIRRLRVEDDYKANRAQMKSN